MEAELCPRPQLDLHWLIRKLHLCNPLICIHVLLRVQRAGRGITSRLALIHEQPGLELLSVLKGENLKDLGAGSPSEGALPVSGLGPRERGAFEAYPVKPTWPPRAERGLRLPKELISS